MTTPSGERRAATPHTRWLDSLRLRAALPPRLPREPLMIGPARQRIGSIEPAHARRMVHAGLPLRRSGAGWQVVGAANQSLAAMAVWLEQQGLAGRWRGELLDVPDQNLKPVAAIERAAVRTLGIATSAVHLVGAHSGGGLWVQQRSLDKATDPGRWDTMMGGQVGAGESPADALERETWEEAGLRLGQLQSVKAVDRFEIRRPVTEGYMVEWIDVYEATVPDDLIPDNQDGEVRQFECLCAMDVAARLEADGFTLEAALILARWLERRCMP